MHKLSGSLLTAVLVAQVTVALADAPAVTSLCPRGVQVGSTAEITVAGKLNQPETRAWCSNPHVAVTVPDEGAKITVEAAPETTPGLCWMRFYNADGATGPLPFVVGRLDEIAEAEPNNELEKPQQVEQSAVVNGKLAAAGDVDVYAVPLKKGQTLVAAIEANWRLGSPVDMVLQIVSATGAVLTQIDDDQGFDPLIAFAAPEDGTWYVRTFGFPATPNSSIRFSGGSEYVYRLTLTTGPYANHAVPSAVTRGTQDGVNLVGWNLTDELKQTVSPTHEPVSRVDHALLALPLPVALVDGKVSIAAEPCHKDMPLVVAAGATVCGVIDKPRDEDSIRFTATKGQKLLLRVESRALGHPLDPVLRIFDATGTLVTESDDATRDVFDPALKFTAKADGEYTVSIRDRFEHGGWRYAWRMHIEELKPTVALTLKADRFVLPADKPLEIPVTIARNDGFNEEIEVTIEGLRDDVSTEAVKSEAKGDTSKSVTLKISRGEDAKAFNGLIQITTRTSSDQTIRATAPLTTFRTSTERIWLTVTTTKEEAK